MFAELRFIGTTLTTANIHRLIEYRTLVPTALELETNPRGVNDS